MKEENFFGGAFGEGETSKLGLQYGQTNDVATNSDSNPTVSADSAKLNLKKFMEYLGNSEAKREKQDRAICNTVRSWVRNKTKNYRSYKEWDCPDSRCVAEKLGRAGVPYQTAYDFVVKNFSDTTKEDFDAGYYQDFDQEFREDILRHLNLL